VIRHWELRLTRAGEHTRFASAIRAELARRFLGTVSSPPSPLPTPSLISAVAAVLSHR